MKDVNCTDWYERLNAAVDYIEDNLSGKIDYSEAADRAYCSVFHFYRVFLAVSGMTPADYARQRKLTLAAHDLLASDIKVIDLAAKYGYESQSAFGKAFRALHGLTPRQARSHGIVRSSFKRMRFPPGNIGGTDMEYRMVEKPAFEIAGRSTAFGIASGEFRKKGRTYWSKYVRTDEYGELCDLTAGKDGTVTEAMVLTAYMANDEGTWDPVKNVFGVEKADGMDTAGFEVFRIPAATYAEFTCSMVESTEMNERIYGEWLTSSEYEHAGTPDIAAFSQVPWNRKIYVRWWIPVVRKS